MSKFRPVGCTHLHRYVRFALLACVFALAPPLAYAKEPRDCRALGSLSAYPAWVSSLVDIGCDTQTISITEVVSQYAKNACKEASAGRVVCSGPVNLKDLKDKTIDGRGAQIVFSDPQPGRGGIKLAGARNVVMRNFVITWEGSELHSPPSEFGRRVQSLAKVEACPGGRAGKAVLSYPDTGRIPLFAVSLWDSKSGWPWREEGEKTTERYLPERTEADFSDGVSNCIAGLAPFIGKQVLLRHFVRSANAVTCRDCERIAVENVTISGAPGMGFLFWGGGHSFLLRNNVIAPACGRSCTQAEPSVAADGAHFVAVSGKILIEGNDFGWQGDDSINITGSMIRGETLLSNAPGRDRGWLNITEAHRPRMWQLAEGKSVQLFDLGLQALGSATVEKIDEANGRVKLSAYPGKERTLVISASDFQPKKVSVRNNHFHDHRARGILMGAEDAEIVGNVIERLTMTAIMLHADTNHSFEGPGARDVLIRRNKIEDVSAQTRKEEFRSPISVGFQPEKNYAGPIGTPIEGIRIEANTVNSGGRVNRGAPVHIGKGVRNSSH